MDETYERILKEIRKQNRDHARRLLQCLVVAIRPLRVEELAEVLAVDFDDAGGIPKLKPSWRWEDQEQAILSSCSSLITVVDARDSRVVQFSHFSVKEFLISPRLATSSADVSRYCIALEPAHTILAQACLSVLLRVDDRIAKTGVEIGSPLAGYAARHWVTHAQFETVSLHIRKAMQFLFDSDKPHFVTWIRLHDMDTKPPYISAFHNFAPYSKSDAAPLYYAALCGFQDLVEHLIVKYPQQVNASGGFYMTPVVAALAGRHFQLAKLLHRNGSSVDPRGSGGQSPLYSVAYYGDLELVGALLSHKADIKAHDRRDRTPLHTASQGGHGNGPKVVQLLLEHEADPNARTSDGETPLHHASHHGRCEVARLLLKHGADLNARTRDGSTPLHHASLYRQRGVAQLLLEHGADPNVRTTDGSTPLHCASRYASHEIVLLLLEHGADPNARTSDGEAPLHHAWMFGGREVAQVLLEHGADLHVRTTEGETPLHRASQHGSTKMAHVLLEHGADLNARTRGGETPLHYASYHGRMEVVQLLLEHGASVKVLDSKGGAAFPPALKSEHEYYDIPKLLAERAAEG